MKTLLTLSRAHTGAQAFALSVFRHARFELLEVFPPRFVRNITCYARAGMGLLEPMPAYYMLKWCNPVSMTIGGFGDDPGAPLVSPLVLQSEACKPPHVLQLEACKS